MNTLINKSPDFDSGETRKLYLVEIFFDKTVSEDERETFLYESAPWGWEEAIEDDQDKILIYVNYFDEAQRLSKKVNEYFSCKSRCRIEEKEKKEWQTIWRDFFKPQVVEDLFLVLPSWEKDQNPSLIPIKIHPQMAFGTGDHPTTYLCLRALACLWKSGSIQKDSFFLYMGTGSGILGIAAASLGSKGIGLDIDPLALDNARLNCLLNGVEDALCLFAGELDSIKTTQGFDLILANIYAEPLQSLCPVLSSLANQSALLVLSGILQSQFSKIVELYENNGWQILFLLQKDGWVALVLYISKLQIDQ